MRVDPAAEPRPPGSGPRRRTLGVFLCWAVVFADIGTSVYYTPGILFRQVGVHAALFVALTLVVFALLSVKYAEVATRYPEGGGVVTVATRTINPLAGLLGGLLILVDYFLTASLSSLSGVLYLSVVAGALKSVVIPATVGALLILGILNWTGVKASAEVTAIFAVAAGAAQLVTVAAVIVHVGPSNLVHTFPQTLSGSALTPLGMLTGYAGAFLAFSGLETIAQLAPVMATPRFVVARRAMAFVVASMVVTSPLLTLWSTTLLDAKHANPDQFISLLGGYAAGQWLSWSVAITAALLLVFASNTAIIGTYHVLLALSRMRFLPAAVSARNRLRQTPHVAIAIAIFVPIAIVVASRASTGILGDLYAFGLLGGFTLTSLGLDIVRWHEQWRGPALWIGILTTVLVALAWTTNFFAKPLATLYGGGITLIGLAIGIATYRATRHRMPAVFPNIRRQGQRIIMLRHGRRQPAAEVLVVLPHDPKAVEPLVRTAGELARRRSIAFVYRGSSHRDQLPHLLEVVDPYLDDRDAHQMFARAEQLGRDLSGDRRFVYIPADDSGDALRQVWEDLQPNHTLLIADQAYAGAIPGPRTAERTVDGLRLVDVTR
jgi:amino acid transporter